jgi:DNA-binding CsgD family transcriptional regulator
MALNDGSDCPDWNDVFIGAALEPERWPQALDHLARHTGASRGQLIGFGVARDVPFNLVTDFEDSAFQEFLAFGGASPALNYRVAANVVAMERGSYDGVLFEKHYDAVLPGLQSDRYIRWCDDHDLPFGCQTNLVVDRSGLIGLATLRRRKDGRTTAAQRRVFADAAAAARRAVRLQERLEGDQARFLAGAFDMISVTAFIFDASGHVTAMTQSAEQLVASGRVSLREGCLEAQGQPISLAQAVRALVSEPGMDHVRLCTQGDERNPPIFIEGFRLPRRPWSLGRLPCAIAVVRKPQRDRAGIAAFLSVLYRLTTTEAEVAMRLYDGKSRAEICEERNITGETLRGYVKMICAKTGAHNEAGLMRLLAPILT